VLGVVRLIFNFISENRRSRKVDELTDSEEFCNVYGSSGIVLVLLYGGWEFYVWCMGQMKINVHLSRATFFSKCMYVSSLFL
jgi:hypothetical protein